MRKKRERGWKRLSRRSRFGEEIVEEDEKNENEVNKREEKEMY